MNPRGDRLINILWPVGDANLDYLRIRDEDLLFPSEREPYIHSLLSTLVLWRNPTITFVYPVNQDATITIIARYRGDELRNNYDILGAINSFYDNPISNEEFRRLLNNERVYQSFFSHDQNRVPTYYYSILSRNIFTGLIKYDPNTETYYVQIVTSPNIA